MIEYSRFCLQYCTIFINFLSRLETINEPKLVTPRTSHSASKSPLDYPTVQVWLKAIKMEQYIPNFQSQGLLTPQDCLLLTESDIRESLGILISSHVNKIMNNIKNAQKTMPVPYL